MAHLLQDLRYALRQIRKAPAFAVTVVLTLAFSIGATTAIFSLVDGVLLQPLAYQESDRLAVVWEKVPFLEKLLPFTEPNPRHAVNWRAAQSVFTALSIVNEGAAGVALAGDHPRFVGRVAAEPNLLSLLQVKPAFGRDFLPDEGAKGKTDRVLISWSLWQELFAGDADVLGKTLQVAGTPMQVIGVLPKNFYFPSRKELTSAATAPQSPRVDILLPNQITPANYGWNSDYGNYAVIGRLKPGVTRVAAEQQLNAINQDLARQAPPGQFDDGPENAITIVVEPLKQVIVGKATTGLYLLLAAVLGLLLIACVNLANAQLARIIARDREAALRTALGASPWSLIRTALTESLLLATLGGALGILFAHLALVRFADFLNVAMPRAANVALNPVVLAASVLCTVAATILFGALPALRSLRALPQSALGSGLRAAGSIRSSRLQRTLIAAQMFACTTLLLLTTLFAGNFMGLLHGPHGFSTEGTVLANVRLQGRAYNNAAIASFDETALDRLRNLPGVSSVALVSSILSQGDMWVDGLQLPGHSGQSQLAQFRWISPGYFTTLGQRIREGRAIDDRDRVPVSADDSAAPPSATPTAAVLSESAAAAIWPHQDPLNRTFIRHDHTYIVVGIAADARTNSPREAPVGMVFLPYWDNPPARAFFLVHGTQPPAALVSAVREAIWRDNPSVTIAEVGPLDSTLEDTLAAERLQTTLLAAFAAAALLLALLGIYGTLSYLIAGRTQEFGVRLALGATHRNVYWITLAAALPPIAAGLAGGWIASLALTRLLHSLLEGTQHMGLANASAILCALAIAALLATSLPCRRAARVQPLEALRTQ